MLDIALTISCFGSTYHSSLTTTQNKEAAENPVKRRGALVFNPGGPGADGLWMTLSLLSAFKLSNPATEIGAMNVRLLAEYDMVGFSPRGTGASTRVHCSSNELLQIEDLSAAGVTSSSLDKSTYNGKKLPKRV